MVRRLTREVIAVEFCCTLNPDVKVAFKGVSREELLRDKPRLAAALGRDLHEVTIDTITSRLIRSEPT